MANNSAFISSQPDFFSEYIKVKDILIIMIMHAQVINQIIRKKCIYFAKPVEVKSSRSKYTSIRVSVGFS